MSVFGKNSGADAVGDLIRSSKETEAAEQRALEAAQKAERQAAVGARRDTTPNRPVTVLLQPEARPVRAPARV